VVADSSSWYGTTNQKTAIFIKWRVCNVSVLRGPQFFGSFSCSIRLYWQKKESSSQQIKHSGTIKSEMFPQVSCCRSSQMLCPARSSQVCISNPTHFLLPVFSTISLSLSLFTFSTWSRASLIGFKLQSILYPDFSSNVIV
jgi:hypothetical protein